MLSLTKLLVTLSLVQQIQSNSKISTTWVAMTSVTFRKFLDRKSPELLECHRQCKLMIHHEKVTENGKAQSLCMASCESYKLCDILFRKVSKETKKQEAKFVKGTFSKQAFAITFFFHISGTAREKELHRKPVSLDQLGMVLEQRIIKLQVLLRFLFLWVVISLLLSFINSKQHYRHSFKAHGDSTEVMFLLCMWSNEVRWEGLPFTEPHWF